MTDTTFTPHAPATVQDVLDQLAEMGDEDYEKAIGVLVRGFQRQAATYANCVEIMNQQERDGLRFVRLIDASPDQALSILRAYFVTFDRNMGVHANRWNKRRRLIATVKRVLDRAQMRAVS